ncbi:hypothetical protein TPR58_22300 [Sphingomonas sp. HF-S3]|uniref:Uncharacterized protein n=2 Tax=Sphingomonas rustica TaxID=3103142 RepID=A0ABV0BGW6_9SPHN
MPERMAAGDAAMIPLAQAALSEAEGRLAPAGPTDFRRELTACLMLCAPAGMAEEDRREWLIAAWGTLQGIPADLLAAGAQAARRRCTHPSQIVPAILETAEPLWRIRRADRQRVTGALARMRGPARPAEPRCTPAQARRIIEALGLDVPAPGARPPRPSVPDWLRERIAAAATPETNTAIPNEDQ